MYGKFKHKHFNSGVLFAAPTTAAVDRRWSSRTWSAVFAEHTAVFAEHAAVFAEHVAVFAEHTSVFAEHTAVFAEHASNEVT